MEFNEEVIQNRRRIRREQEEGWKGKWYQPVGPEEGKHSGDDEHTRILNGHRVVHVSTKKRDKVLELGMLH